jgi:hypothetical protein
VFQLVPTGGGSATEPIDDSGSHDEGKERRRERI